MFGFIGSEWLWKVVFITFYSLMRHVSEHKEGVVVGSVQVSAPVYLV
jgi:hypothetical protein